MSSYWHEWSPSTHFTLVNNEGEAWGTCSAMKGNDGVSAVFMALLILFKIQIS